MNYGMRMVYFILKESLLGDQNIYEVCTYPQMWIYLAGDSYDQHFVANDRYSF
jgi:hypothetical protein